MGALDENGIYQYTEDEEAAPGGLFSALLNKLAESVSPVIAALTGRVSALETLTSASSSVSSGVITAASGWKITEQHGVKRSGAATIDFYLERTGSAISVPATGDIGNTVIGTLSSAWAAVAEARSPLSTTYSGRVIAAYISLGVDVRLSAVAPGGDIATGDTFAIAGNYPLA